MLSLANIVAETTAIRVKKTKSKQDIMRSAIKRQTSCRGEVREYPTSAVKCGGRCSFNKSGHVRDDERPRMPYSTDEGVPGIYNKTGRNFHLKSPEL